jgi:hypothetical protein
MSEGTKLILLIALVILSGLFGFLIGYIFRSMREIEIRAKAILRTLKPTEVEKEDSQEGK